MIRIIKNIFVRDLDDGDNFRREVPMVPAVYTADVQRVTEEGGIRRKLKMTVNISRPFPELRANAEILIIYDNGRSDIFGTKDLPVHFDVKEGSPLQMSVEYECPIAI